MLRLETQVAIKEFDLHFQYDSLGQVVPSQTMDGHVQHLFPQQGLLIVQRILPSTEMQPTQLPFRLHHESRLVEPMLPIQQLLRV